MSGEAQESRQYSFTHFSTVNGLSANLVNNLVQDDRGYIWLATSNGLQRYDGNNFLTFTRDPDNIHSIPSENVLFVYKDKKGRLWVATIDNKIGIFDTEKFIYYEAEVEWGSPPTYFFSKSLLELSDGKLILYTSLYGEYLWDETRQKFVSRQGLIPAPPNWKKFSIVEDSFTHRFWMACDSGLAVYNPGTKQLSYRNHNLENDPLIGKVENERNFYSVMVDRQGRYFFYNWPSDKAGPRYIFYNPKNGAFGNYYLGEYVPIGYFEIYGTFCQRNGRIWTYGAAFMTEFIEGDARPFRLIPNEFKNEQSIKFDRMQSIFEDNQNNLWLCTDNGVFLFNPDAQFFNAFNLLRPGEKRTNDIPAIAALHMKNNQIWVSSWGNGIYIFDESLNGLPLPPYLQQYQAAYSIWNMMQDKFNDDVWMGVQGGHVIRCNPARGSSEIATPDIFNRSTVRQMAEDNEGNLWFGTQNGMLIKWDRNAAGNDINKGYSKVTTTGMVMKLITDARGDVWMASMSFGVYRIDSKTGKVLERFHKLAPAGKQLWTDSPHDLFIHNDSMLIVPCDALNIINMNTNLVELISTKDGLPSNTARCVQRDSKGNFWVGMANGMLRMNIEKKIFAYYDRRDGIVFDHFNSAGAYALGDGRLVFTTDHNFLTFDPPKMLRIGMPNNVEITDFKLANKPLLMDSLKKLDQVKLAYDNTSILIEFNNLNFIKQNKIRYFYKLEGIDKDWITAEDNHQAVYTWLPPGDYIFKVNCQNGDGFWSNDITSLNIHVASPFWKTLWFYGILILIAAGILYGIDQERVKRMRSLQEMRSQIAGNLHQEINTTLSNINLLSEMAKIKADKNLDRSKEYIDQIGEKSHNMITAMDDILWSIQPENDSMEKTILRIEEFADALRNRYGTTIELQVDKRARNLQLDMKTRHEFFLIFKEALRTFVQYADAKEVLIYLDHSGSKLALKIQSRETVLDSEILQMEKSIAEMKKRALQIRAVLDIQTDARTSNIILLLPLV